MVHCGTPRDTWYKSGGRGWYLSGTAWYLVDGTDLGLPGTPVEGTDLRLLGVLVEDDPKHYQLQIGLERRVLVDGAHLPKANITLVLKKHEERPVQTFHKTIYITNTWRGTA